MRQQENNYAFIDSQNLSLAICGRDRRLDYRRFRRPYFFIVFAMLLFNCSLLYAGEESYCPEGQGSRKEIIKKRKDLSSLQRKIQECEKGKRQARRKEKVAAKDLRKIDGKLKARRKEINIYDWNLEKNKRQQELLLTSFQKLVEQKQTLGSCLIEELRLRFKESLIPQFIISPVDLGSLTIQDGLENFVDRSIISFGETLNKELNFKETERDKLGKYRELELTYKKAAEKKEKKAKTLHQKKKKELTRHQRAKKQQDKKLKEFRGQIPALEKMIKRLKKAQRATGSFRDGRFSKSKGKLLMPANGSLAKARYGNSSDIYKGIMIKAPAGSEVFSVANGEVLYGDWFRGFGNIVIINHGGGYSTLYAHLQKLLVKTKEKVGEGQIIARVGDTGALTREPRLYFEIRRHGESLNPLEWLGR